MRKSVKLIVSAFIVSWQVGMQYQSIPCAGKEPEGVVCAKGVAQRTEKSFKTAEQADAFRAGLVAEGTKENIKMEEVHK